MTRVLVLNGPNLGRLGRRQPEIYGTTTHAELAHQCVAWGAALGLEVEVRQTNHEGEYVEYLHRLPETADGAILNPGSWTHYSWAIRDALELTGLPAVEIHISDVDSREEWRRHSVFDGLVAGRVAGKGMEGYREALEILAGEFGKDSG